MEGQSWQRLAKKLDWSPSYVDLRDLFPAELSGTPWLDHSAWQHWDEPFRNTFAEYVCQQAEKESAVEAVREALARTPQQRALDPAWVSAVQLHAATLPLAEFAAVVGNLRATRFARDGAWRTMALYGALDELRHTQIPLELMHDKLGQDPRFDWTHRFYHSDNWVAIAGRHLFDEMLLFSNAIEFAVATNFVFETGFTNLQFIGLSALAERVQDSLFGTMISTIQTDEARHAQIGPAVLEVVARHDPAEAQRLVDKWFWRSWVVFAVVTGFAMDYLTPLHRRTLSFKEFVAEWIVEQFLPSLAALGLQRPWYWSAFERSVDYFHHMIYASAYSYRATVWFDFVLPGPDERAWLRRKYPQSWNELEPTWERMTDRWRRADPGLDFAVHGTAIPTFCHLCQLVLCQGTPSHNEAVFVEIDHEPRVFCSEPCRWIFEQEPERYRGHRDVVARVLAGEAPGNLIEFLTRYSGLCREQWGKDIQGGRYPWLVQPEDA